VGGDVEQIYAIARQFSSECCRHYTISAEVLDRIVVTGHELLDNAIRGSLDGACAWTLFVSDQSVVLETQNRASAVDIHALALRIDEMAAAPATRRWLFVEILKESSRHANARGIGLGRVYAEQEMEITYALVADTVTLRAWCLV
jgi:hypothetical protein